MKVSVVSGTRLEATKVAPIIKEMQKRSDFDPVIAVAGQHREMLDQVLEIFQIQPDHDSNIFKAGQSPTCIAAGALGGLEGIIKEGKSDCLLTRGDTTTVFSGALAAFYQEAKVGHVEVGLRSNNLYSPYPGEANRRLAGILGHWHFTPTEKNRDDLLREGVDPKGIYLTGNTVTDALKCTVQRDCQFEESLLNSLGYENKKVILLTTHRRENIGQPMKNIFSAIRRIVDENPQVEMVFPRHKDPKVRELSDPYFKDHDRIHCIEPLDYLPFTSLMNRTHFVATDSEGIQEEAPALGKPVLVVRREAERPEGVEVGAARLVEAEEESLYQACQELLTQPEAYEAMVKAVNPYGDGQATRKICDALVGRQ